jgi:thioredoxin reductase (NADPH)
LAVTETGQRRLTLFIRAYCHLCDDMREALSPLAAMFGWTVDEIDIDADAFLEKRWGDAVPVLVAGEQELCRYRIDAAAVTAFLSAPGANSR